MKATNTQFKQITHFDGCRKAPGQQARVEDTRAAAREFRKDMLAGKKVRYFESFDLVTVPYPSRYGLRNAFSRERYVEYLHIRNRMFVVQFDTDDGLKTLLVSPSDHEHNVETPFFRRLADKSPEMLERLVVKRHSTVPEILARIGLAPEDVDYITYDHLHTQEVRRWLGSDEHEAFFPNAKLLVHWREWESVRDLNPYQADWYCPNGVRGIPEHKVHCFDGSIELGDGIALVHTPGHTEGNHSIVTHTDEGLWVTSENGVSVDAYAPELSAAAGVAEYAKTIGTEVIINGNTLENAIDQYISMVQEKTIAGPSARDSRFPNVFPSSEMTPFWAFPGAKPAFYVGHARHGALTKKRRAETA
ncbi:hypothetical protein [Marinobacter mobilis]|uniref:Metallo-beta-lactamase superfamily protein n=1 Tax=Marinobacter mobilis TaxID=488533 RepID=A0A1H3AVS8_9GAMM|nr:hypothetical protein [Marinobacter mobilis]SDX33705.1 hypothetical protein SAMN04487960_108117 [Marinobacter mobilis]